MASSRTADADIGVEVAVGVLGLMGAVYDPWCPDPTVSVYVNMSRTSGVLILIVCALGTLAWAMAESHQLRVEERSVWTAAAILATAATAPVIGRGAAMLFLYGNKSFEVLQHAKGPDDSLRDVATGHWFTSFLWVYAQSMWFVVGKISLRRGLADMARKFFCEDLRSNFRVLLLGSKDNDDGNFHWSWHSWMERSMRGLTLILDIFGVLYFVGHLVSAAIEVIITFIGAFWVCLAFAWTYTTCKVKTCQCIQNGNACTCVQIEGPAGSATHRAVDWKDLLTCARCRNGTPCALTKCPKHLMFPPP